jgi:glycosyltransferase involved in cell wall biosynthesis
MRPSPLSGSRRHTRVCFVAPKAYPLFDPQVQEVFGGAEVDLYFLATELAKDADFQVTVIVGDYGQAPVETREGVTLVKGLDFHQGDLRGMARLWRIFRQAGADIYFIKTVSPGVPWLALFCKVHHKAFVYRTSSAAQYDTAYRQRHRLMGKAFDWALRRARTVFAQSEETASALRRDVGLSTVQVIPNGHRLGTPQDRPREIVLWVGRSDRMKGPERFIDLAMRLPHEQFVMICQRAFGDDDYPRLVDRALAVTNLQFIERVPFDQIDPWFQRAKVFVNTSDSEGFPNTFIQAAQWAVPIMSLNANPDRFLSQYQCGLCADGSFDRLAEGLRLLLANGRFVEIGQNARRYVEQHHDITVIVEKYKQAFRGLV